MAHEHRFAQRAKSAVSKAALYQLVEDMAVATDDVRDALTIIVKRLERMPPVPTNSTSTDQ